MTFRVLDGFCGAGGAGMGYSFAGAEVTGVDISYQAHYPFDFQQTNFLNLSVDFLREFDLIHVSPPCQAYTQLLRVWDNEHPELVAATRELLIESGVPFVIENVVGAPLRDPVTLCGAMFEGLRVYRHRLFETSFPLSQPEHPSHVVPQRKLGRPVAEGEFIQVAGNFSGAEYARAAMGICWMTRSELSQAIPPRYTEYVANEFLNLKELAA